MLKYGKQSDEVINRSVENMERLDKLLAATGKWSRKEAKALIKAGRVRVEDHLPKGPEDKVEEGSLVTVDAKEKTVLDLLPKDLRRKDLFPVGRLDKDTEGLLLLTNDGALAHALLAPGRHVDKVYYTKVDGSLEGDDVAAFAEGITLGDGTVCLPAGLDLISEHEALVTLREGKYHQVKRMLASRGKPVVYLKRLGMGELKLDPALPAGAWRPLTPEELADLGR